MLRSGFASASKFGWVALAGLMILCVETGCVKRKGGLSSKERDQLKEHVLDELPGDVPHKVDVNFEDKVHLVGWKAEPEVAAPGAKIDFTLYWKKSGDLDPDWKLFTHLTTDDPKQALGNADCVGAIRASKVADCGQQLFGPSDWEKGKFVKDTFDWTVPTNITTPKIRVLVGVWKGNSRLQIKNLEAADAENRANVIVLNTGVKPPEPPVDKPVPSTTAPKHTTNTIKIDGKLDEPEWQKAGATGPFVAPVDGKTPPDHPVNATAKYCWDDANLYFGFVVDDKDPQSPFKPGDKDPHIWAKASGVEIMLQPGDPGDNKDYYELQVDSNGAVYDTHWDDFRQPESGGPDDDTKVFGHMDWASNLKAAVNVEKGARYTIELAIPWASFAKPRMGTLPPTSGDVWRMNLYSFRDGQRSALAWSPLFKEGSFHRTSKFGKIVFVDPTLAPAPSASATGSASAAPSGSAPIPAGSLRIVRPTMPQRPPTPPTP